MTMKEYNRLYVKNNPERSRASQKKYFDSNIAGGTCSICGKYFKNNTRRRNISLNLENGKFYCKMCALDEAWIEAKGNHE